MFDIFGKLFLWVFGQESVTRLLYLASKVGIQDYVLREELREVIEKTMPGDIILVEKFGELTSTAIPGDFSHAAIRVENNNIVDMTTKGLGSHDILSALIPTCRICVLRLPFDVDTREQVVTEAYNAIYENPDYDWGFDPEDKDWYCSEAIYHIVNRAVPNFFKMEETAGVKYFTPESIYNNEKLAKIIDLKK